MAQSQYGGRSDLSDKASDLNDEATEERSLTEWKVSHSRLRKPIPRR
jgi:hypothetical protein